MTEGTRGVREMVGTGGGVAIADGRGAEVEVEVTTERWR